MRWNVRATVAAMSLAAALPACASGGGPAVAPPPKPPAQATTPATAAAHPLPPGLVWVRRSAEHRGVYLEVYRAAGDQLDRLAAAAGNGPWAVILDADETVLDNSAYEAERAAAGEPYREASWSAWVGREAAPALPGAVEFLRHVHRLGGHVAIVTNRAESLCPATRANLEKDGLLAEVVLCRPPTTGDKNPRFRAIQNGTATPGLPPLRILMWLGDNIQDFPGLSQSLRQQPDSAYARFGRDFFLLPNPMYGSWVGEP